MAWINESFSGRSSVLLHKVRSNVEKRSNTKQRLKNVFGNAFPFFFTLLHLLCLTVILVLLSALHTSCSQVSSIPVLVSHSGLFLRVATSWMGQSDVETSRQQPAIYSQSATITPGRSRSYDKETHAYTKREVVVEHELQLHWKEREKKGH